MPMVSVPPPDSCAFAGLPASGASAARPATTARAAVSTSDLSHTLSRILSHSLSMCLNNTLNMYLSRTLSLELSHP